MRWNTNKLRVLVVDDDVDAAASLCGLLQHMNCEACAAWNLASAQRAAVTFKPELVVLDLDMPEADGCEVLRAVKSLGGEFENALYVCLTGSNPEESRRRCEQAGFDRFYTKPIWVQDLAALLDEAGGRRSEAHRRRQRMAASQLASGAVR